MKHTSDDMQRGAYIQAALRWKEKNPELHAKYERRRRDRKRTPEELQKLIDQYERRISELKEVLADKRRHEGYHKLP